MRPSVRPSVSSFLDTVFSTTRTPLATAITAQRRPFAAVCVRCQFRGTVARKNAPTPRAVRQPAGSIRGIRRWQSNSHKPRPEEATSDAISESAVEDRLRRAREEYTSREIIAQRAAAARAEALNPPPPKVESPKVEAPKELPVKEPPKEELRKVDTQQEETQQTGDNSSIPAEPSIPAPPPPPSFPPPQPATRPSALRSPRDTPSPTPSTLKDRLPSHFAARRSEITARVSKSMEQLLSNLAVASQRLNTYTGTDYTAISSLRDDIIARERLVKSSHHAVATAKDAYAAAFAAQAASQKEVVQLLERKHSWSATDLERYMSLIRSEHLNEQGVQAAKDDLGIKERALEEVRARLERSERRLYHEEQIWSDTIRRNSTWVTFGLMGFNVILLLASLLVFEPWRRRRIVREIRSALDEKTTPAPAFAAPEPAQVATPPTTSSSVVEKAVDAVVSPASETLETIQAETPLAAADVVSADTSVSEPSFLADPAPSGTTPQTAPSPATSDAPTQAPTSPSQPSAEEPDILTTSPPPAFTTTTPFPYWADTWTATWALYKAHWADLFSERRVALRKVDLTATALEGAAAGAACMGLLFVLLRPR